MPVKNQKNAKGKFRAPGKVLGAGAAGLRTLNPVSTRSLEDAECRAAISFRGLLTPLIGPVRALSLGSEEDYIADMVLEEPIESAIQQMLAPRRYVPFDFSFPSRFAVWMDVLVGFMIGKSVEDRKVLRRWAEGEAMLLSLWSRSFASQVASGLQRLNCQPKMGTWESYVFLHLGTLDPRRFGRQASGLRNPLETVAGVRDLFQDVREKDFVRALERANEWVSCVEAEESGRGVDDSGSKLYSIDMEALLSMADLFYYSDVVEHLDPFLVIDLLNLEYALDGYALTAGARELLWSAQLLCRSE